MSEEEKNKKKVKEKKKRTLLQKIVNVFLYCGLGLLILLLILLGITQTSTFREYLRETIIEEANSSLNGKLYIGEIEGTIFTSLVLKNTSITMDGDTLLKAETIGLMTSPLQLLLKKIHIRYFEIENASINLERDSSGEINLTKLFPPSEEDTTESEFPFVIQIANLKLENVNLSFKDYTVKTSADYDSFNFNDIRIKNLNMDMSAKLDISDNIYEVSLDHLSFKPNVRGFNLKELEGEFFVNEKGLLAKDLFFKTDKSEVMINASATELNIFDTLGIKPENANLKLQAGSGKFSFDDVRAFDPSLDMLKGNIEFGIIASGTTQQLNIKDIRVKLDKSKIEGTVEVRNLLKENLFVNADLSGSYVDQNDIKNLLAGMEVPVYPELGLIEFEKLTYTGDPLIFKSEININTEKGNVEGIINLNLKNDPIQYEVNLITNEIDIEPFAGVKSSLNITAEIKGEGVSPETFDGTIRLFANGSSVNGNNIDTLRLTADAENKFIDYSFHLVSNQTIADLNGNFDFKSAEPIYKINGSLSNLNIAEFTSDTSLNSNLNLSLEGDGNGFNQDSIDLFMTATLHNSEFSNVKIDTTRLIIDLRSQPGEERVINIISDLADITIMGDYKIDQAMDLILSEVTLLSTAFNEKINSILPAGTKEIESETKAGLKIKIPLFAQVTEPTSFNYLIDLKDFSLVSAFIQDYDLEIDAEMGGRFESTPDDSVLFTFDTDLKYIKVYSDSEAYFISNMELDFAVQNNFEAKSTSELNLNLNTNTEWIFVGNHIYNLAFTANLENDIADINLSAQPDPFASKIITKIDLSNNQLDISIDTLKFIYGNFIIENRNDLNLSYDGDKIDIKQFQLLHNNSELNIKGYLSQSGNQDLNINLYDWKGKDISINFINAKPENTVNASINLETNIKGTFNSPIINAKLLIDSITYGNKTFGKLESIFNYDNKNLGINLAFLDSMLNKNDTALTLK
ncbi:MAG TPA: AsmA family protein, partial [Ignavibacteriaceae bacterium]|nr:AsmA family protein [Ignavibacteriaceae bacterium]